MTQSCIFGSVSGYDGLDSVVYGWNGDGPVTGPNGELELDHDKSFYDCNHRTRPVFATCKNNCPGGELSVIL